MPDRRARLNTTSSAPAPNEPTVELELSTQDVEVLLRLRDAGLIDLDLQGLANQDPRLQEWTYDGFQRDLVARRDYAESTAYQYRCYLKTLEGHTEAPVDLRPPDEEGWKDFVWWNRRRGRDGNTLNNYRDALRALLAYLSHTTGQRLRWESLEGVFACADPTWRLPSDDVVPQFWLTTEWDDIPRLEARNLAYVYHAGFHIGMRPPSEICSLSLSDWDPPALTLTEAKKRGRRRSVDVPAYVGTAQNAKSLETYLDHVRPELDQGKTDALFLTPEGERWGRRQLAHQLKRVGRRIWPEFVPYHMRRWYATSLLIATDYNVYVVAERLGDTVATVERHYLHRARARAAMGQDHHLPRLHGRHAP